MPRVEFAMAVHKNLKTLMQLETKGRNGGKPITKLIKHISHILKQEESSNYYY